jgi:biotin carboxyl carrier protein
MSELKKFILDDRVYETHFTRKFLRRKPYVPADPNRVLAHIPGVIRKIYVAEGQEVARGDRLLVLEAMKMQNDVVAHNPGTVAHIPVEAGQMVAKGQVLLEFASFPSGPRGEGKE